MTTARDTLFLKVQKLYEEHSKILCQMATGSGKTKIAIELSNADENWSILVPRKPLIKTWHEEMEKWGYKDLIPKINILCYASAHKLLPGNNNIILDEAHRVTDRNMPFIKDFVGTGKIIGLSATVPAKKKELLEQLGLTPANTVKYSLDDAVDDDIVADYNIRVIQFSLNDTDKNIEAGKKGAYFKTTEAQGYIFKDQRVRQAIYSSDPMSIKFAMINRMRFIYDLPSKVHLAKELLRQIPADKKVIVFCGSIKHANLICDHRFHSGTDSTDYDAFCAGKINRLSAVQSIAEGVNIPNLDYAILLQVQSEALHAIQKIGRLVRKTDDPTKVGQVFVLEALGTQDSKWVASALQKFDPAKINYISSQQFLLKGL